ncbi:COR domain-containing protein [Candidatus Parabeggiatoa sp. HSG14]|uniref:COR domain-containing protein n=1 Tax=Candidatus Parabeggiatoa sp. HSG14 TaxID=3055593 RepID=UPI0025A8C41C|nr:COR domain-containing protein [Thiotrichales bacterium HSG14]
MNNETITQQINQATESKKLDLCEQQLTTIPPTVFELTDLEELYLDTNQLAKLPAEIAQLVNLRVLSLTDNQLKTLLPSIAKLKNLEWLYLSENQLEELPTEITQLPHLKVLSLDRNQLTVLPQEITSLPNLKVLSLYDNPLISPPPEIIAQGTAAILSYLRPKEMQQQWAAKLLLVGEGGVGKTSLLHQLRGEIFDNQEESTYGIEVDIWKVKHPLKDVTMQLKTWDFGGQTIYHATHQFFLTNRSLFILVWNARLGYEQGKLSYWLNIIQAKAKDSPILLVATHIDKGYDAILPFAELQNKYPQLSGDKCYKINNLTGTGVNEIRQAIAAAAAKLPMMGEDWPIHWLEAANAIRAKTEKSMTPNQLQSLMTAYGLAQDECITLSNWLHELGDLLYFLENEDLKNVVILKPQWVTEHISRVLISQEVINKQGILTDTYRDTLWQNLEFGMREHFLSLMENFDLSYRALDDRHTSFIVELLPQDPPDYKTAWEAMQGSKEIRMTYQLTNMNSLPPGIPTWFIARAHRFTTNTHWRYGALFADSPKRHHLGLIRAFPEERRLELAVRGSSPHHFFTILRDGLELTLQRYSGLKITRKIPCLGHNGESCSGEFDYAYLEKAIQKNKVEIECQEALEKVSVPKLLFALDWHTQDAVLQKLDELKTEMTGTEENISNLFKLMQRNFRKTDLQCPHAFTLSEQKAKWWQPFAAHEVKLQLYCQYPDNWHKTQNGGCYHLHEIDKWSHLLAPHLSRLIMVFNAIMTFGLSTVDRKNQLKNDLFFMNKLAQQFPHIEDHVDDATKRGLCILLEELDSSHHWGGLKPVHIKPQGDILWLCEKHAREYNPPT